MIVKALAKLVVDGKVSIEGAHSLLMKYKLLALFPALTNEIGKVIARERVNARAVLRSSHDISDSSAQKILEKYLGSSKVPYSVHVDKTLLAGFVLTHKKMSYDASARRVINEFLK